MWPRAHYRARPLELAQWRGGTRATPGRLVSFPGSEASPVAGAFQGEPVTRSLRLFS